MTDPSASSADPAARGRESAVRDLLSSVPVIPVLTVNRVESAVPLARALVDGGLRLLEVTLRTDAALEAMAAMAEAVPDAVVGAGTITSPKDLEAVAAIGARFAVSPGLTPALREAAPSSPVPLVPGVATASEAMTAFDAGFGIQKLFPAEAVGGQKLLRAIGGPLPQLAFCPTGGIGAGNYRDYLALPNVICVGGSWVAPKDAIESGDFWRITELAREACSRAAAEE